MFRRHRGFSAGAAALFLAVGTAGCTAVGADQAGSTPGPLRCEIQASSASGMIALAGVVEADAPVSGSYRFRVVSAGRGGGSNIDQGGNFTAGPGAPVTIGKVTLGGGGAVYDASLTVTANGVTVDCAERVGGAI